MIFILLKSYRLNKLYNNAKQTPTAVNDSIHGLPENKLFKPSSTIFLPKYNASKPQKHSAAAAVIIKLKFKPNKPRKYNINEAKAAITAIAPSQKLLRRKAIS